MASRLALIALAGAAGTLCRYGLSSGVQRFAGAGFPWGTWSVNALGSFLFGFVWMLAEDRFVISAHTRFIILTGFMGAFTTFSTFAFETDAMLREGQWFAASGNVAGQTLLGLLCVFLGITLGKWV